MKIEAVAVVVPARDEEAQIGACLSSIIEAAEAVLPLPVLIVVVDDASSDRTSEVGAAAMRGRMHILAQLGGPNVGRARSQGAALALAALSSFEAASIWLAFTDADSCVPRDWLSRQLALAEAGADAVGGIVQLPPEERVANPTYEATYAAGVWEQGHRHVHGANMGVNAAAYLAVGGFAALAVGEDNDLWQRLRDSKRRMVADTSLVVQTSARHQSRVTGGLATFLAQLKALASE